MKRNTILRRRALPLFTLVVILSLLAGCNMPASFGGVSVWIDVPLDGLVFPDAQAINIEGHATSPGGVSRVEVWINGALLTTINDPPMEGKLAAFHAEWIPPAPGEYTIQALAFGADGASSSPDSARVTFGEAASLQCALEALVAPSLVSPMDGAALAPDPVLAWAYPDTSCHPYSFMVDISEDASFADISWGFGTLDHRETSRSWPLPAGHCYYWRVRAYVPDVSGPPSSAWRFCVVAAAVTDTPTPVISVTPVITDTPTLPPPASAVIQFWSEPAEIEAGACTDIRWHVENVNRVVFGGIDQPFDGSYSDCLCTSQRYTLIVTHLDGSEERRTVNVGVSGTCITPVTPTFTPTSPPPSDTTPPPAPSPAVPASGLTIVCKAAQSLAWLPVSDPSGISEYQVQVQRHAGDNNWQAAPGGSLNVADKTVNVPVECGWYHRWRVRAVDGAGNVGDWSGWWLFTITLS